MFRPPAAPSWNGSKARRCRASKCLMVPRLPTARESVEDDKSPHRRRRHELRGGRDESCRTEQSRGSDGRARPRHPGRRRIHRHDQEALRRASACESTADNRRDYREMLFRTTEAMSKYISGVILYDETIRQNAKDGTPLVKLIEKAGALPGIKVDKGTKPLPFCPGEVITEGLDGLRERLVEYRGLGAKFAKWRAVIDIGSRHPELQLHQRQCACARALCRAVPGRRHRADRRARSADGRRSRHRPLRRDHRMGAQDRVRAALLSRASRSKAWCSSPTWSCPARSRGKRASVEEVAEKTLRVLKACVPAAVPGIAFLSGGQSDEEATAHLDAMNRMGPLPWRAHVLLWPRAAARAADDLVGQAGERRGGATRLQPPRHDERARHARPVESRPRAQSGVS